MPLSPDHPDLQPDEYPPSTRPRKDDVRLDAQRAVAIAHGRGAGMSLLALFALVLEEGLPSRAERERMLAARLQEDRLGDTTPALLGGTNAPDSSSGVGGDESPPVAHA